MGVKSACPECGQMVPWYRLNKNHIHWHDDDYVEFTDEKRENQIGRVTGESKWKNGEVWISALTRGGVYSHIKPRQLSEAGKQRLIELFRDEIKQNQAEIDHTAEKEAIKFREREIKRLHTNP